MISITPKLCKSCGYCIKFCPKNILEMGSERSEKGFFYPILKDKDICLSCAVCATVCPEGAIELKAEEK